MKNPLTFVVLLLALGVASMSFTSSLQTEASLYERLFPAETPAPSMDAFKQALHGYHILKEEGRVQKDIIAIADFTMASTEKRLWVIDLKTNTVKFHTLVSHGKNSGSNYAKSFSNRPQSYQTSVGFYVTRSVYNGKHGLSLRLDGLEPGFNDNAMDRAIVMHGADYVSQSFIEKIGRLGRSHGCPAVPVAVHRELIQSLKGGACLFIWYPEEQYLINSRLIDRSA